ncbi:MAG: RNA polymerase sigma factor [Gammaproteobacteria bacterium]|nr:RNA polymerase sigma factor [Gammaproteobacteria bacterium]
MTPRRDRASLAETVERAQHGDREAFRDLVLRFQDMAVGYAFSLLKDFHLAEDAAQEALVAVFFELKSLRSPNAFVPWLRTVVRKHCDRISRRRQPDVPLEEQEERWMTDAPSPLDAIEQGEVSELVGRAIASLPQKQRDVVTLYYIGEKSSSQVAEFLNLPITTVKKRLHDAKPKLRRSTSKLAKRFLSDHKPSESREFSDRVLRFTAPDRAKDAPTVYNLFEAEDHPSRHEWRGGRLSDSHADWDASRVAFIQEGGDEKLVAALNVYDLTMQIGQAEVRVAGINGDVLDAELTDWRENVFDRIVSDALKSLSESGYDLVVTFDDESFWLRHGFTLGWRALQWQVKVTDLPLNGEQTLERVESTHREELAAVYNASSTGLTGTVRRPTYRRNKHPGEFSTYMWRNSGGQIAGYVSGNPGPGEASFWVDEVAGDAETCLAALRSVADAEQCAECYFDRLHYKSAVGTKLRQMSSCRLFTGTRNGRARWYVAKIVNLKTLMTKIAPLLSDRLQTTGFAEWPGALSICLQEHDASQEITLVTEEGGVQVVDGADTSNCISGDQSIVQLVLGCETPDEVIASNGIEVKGERTADLVSVLFPAQYPQMENQAL